MVSWKSRIVFILMIHSSLLLLEGKWFTAKGGFRGNMGVARQECLTTPMDPDQWQAGSEQKAHRVKGSRTLEIWVTISSNHPDVLSHRSPFAP